MHEVQRFTRVEAVKIIAQGWTRKIDVQHQRRFEPEDRVVEVAASIPAHEAAVRRELPPQESPDRLHGIAQSVAALTHRPAYQA
jgi:hypothetical protein